MQKRVWDGWEGRVREVDDAFRPRELEVLKRLLGRVPDAATASRDAAGGAVA
jgi:hypothetical protein